MAPIGAKIKQGHFETLGLYYETKKSTSARALVLQRVIKYPGTRHVGTRPGPGFKRFGITRARLGPGYQYPGVPESLESSNFLKKYIILSRNVLTF